MLDIKNNITQIFKHLSISLLTLVFSMIYESYSHDVYSSYMIYAFLIPLSGALVYLITYLLRINKYVSLYGIKLFNSFIYTFTLGSIIKGVLEIYGTTNVLSNVYLIISIILLATSIIINIKSKLKIKKV